MSTFPRSPRVLKGALIGLDPFNPLASVTIFQYNPERLTRTLSGRFSGTAGGSGTGGTEPAPGLATGRPVRIVGPPTETITLEVKIDATDQLEKGDGLAGSVGIHPQLAALEMLLYPKTALIVANALLAQAGLIQVQRPEAPLTLLVWGIQRVVPVRITQFSITESLYDPSLNPIQASIQLGLQVLNYDDLGLLSVGGGVFMAHQIIKEVMATISGVGAVAGVLGATL